MISLIGLDALYLFQDVGFRVSQLQNGRSFLAHEVTRFGERPATAWLLQIPVPVPLEFLRGLDFQLADTERLQSAYLFGRTRLGGWWYWYPVASLIKIPLPAMGLILLSLMRLPMLWRQADAIVWAVLCLLLPAAEAALLVSATTGTGTNAAFRYLIPSIALVCVWSGQAAKCESRVIQSMVIGCLCWLLLNAVLGFHDHLAWQNELGSVWSRWTGRPALIGDSLDWGQDQARLGAWVERQSDSGTTEICIYGVGDGEPYALTPPNARPLSGATHHSRYLAVSEDVLFGYEPGICVQIAGGRCFMGEAEREALLRSEPFTRVGRTIRIYRMRDIPSQVSAR
jgi:hypothetical protein